MHESGTRQKYGGKLLHCERDEYGLLEVVQSHTLRSLHFGSEPKQSCLDLDAPLHLSLGYTRAMMSALLFNPAPRRVLMIGLGGGSLASFLLHHFPHCRIDAVEQREQVHHLARRFFHLPDDERLQVHIDDAARFIRQAEGDTYGEYDLILVDAYTERGMSLAVCGLSFYQACHARMAADGVLSANLWMGDTISLREQLEDIRDSFDNQVVKLHVEGKGNVIALATAQPSPRQRLRRLGETAQALRRQTGLELPNLLRQLRKHNRWLLG